MFPKIKSHPIWEEIYYYSSDRRNIGYSFLDSKIKNNNGLVYVNNYK